MRITSKVVIGAALVAALLMGVHLAQAQSGSHKRRPVKFHQKIEFSGKVQLGEEYRREIGGGLVFYLTPNLEGTGWTIEICPAQEKPCGNDYVWVVSPPYRSSNPRYIDTAYGIAAEEAVKWSPRTFRFVMTTGDYESATILVDRLYTSAPTDNPRLDESEREHYHNNLERLIAMAGRGELRITNSKVESGRLVSIDFTVKIEIPKLATTSPR